MGGPDVILREDSGEVRGKEESGEFTMELSNELLPFSNCLGYPTLCYELITREYSSKVHWANAIPGKRVI